MRKFLSAVLIALVVTFSTNCSANRYDNDPNWYFFMSFHCWNCYLYLPSVDVQEYNPPHYQIAGRYANIGYRHNEGQS